MELCSQSLAAGGEQQRWSVYSPGAVGYPAPGAKGRESQLGTLQ